MRKNAKKKLLAVALIGTLLCSTALSGIAIAADGDVTIDDANFPDKVFQEYVRQFDTDGTQGTLSQEERERVEKITIIFREELITLEGIEHFPNLNYLLISDTQLEEVDLSQNSKLSNLLIAGSPIKALDVSRLTELCELNINNTQITALDLANNPNLALLYLSDTQITTLDLTKNPMLDSLSVSNTPITALDLANNPNLAMLYFSDTQITTLDLTKNPILFEIYCENSAITALDLTNSPYLKNIITDGSKLAALNLHPNVTLNGFSLEDNNLNLGEIPSNNYNLKEEIPNLDPAKITITAPQGVTIDDKGIMSGYTKDATEVTYEYKTGNDKYTLKTTLTFTVKEMDTDKYEATGGTIDKKFGEKVTEEEIKAQVTVTPTPDGQVTKTVTGSIPTAGKNNAVEVTVTYADNSTDVATVTVNFEDQPTTPTETETETETKPETKPTTEPETNPTTEPTTETETKPVATSSNTTKNGSKSSGSKKPSASTNGSVGPTDNTNTSTTEPAVNTNEAIAPANNANTDGTESLVNAAMKGMLPKTGDMMNLNLTLAGLLGSLTGLAGLVASKKRKKS